MGEEVPLEHAQETIEHHAHQSGEKWVMGVALTAAILAALAAVSALLAEHHSNEALLLRIQANDDWSAYGTDSIKEKVIEIKEMLADSQGKPHDPKDAERFIKYKKDMEKLQEEAKEKQDESTSHIHHHLPLSFGLTMFQVAIAIGAISVLTKKKAFWFVAITFGAIGSAFMVGGLLP